MKGGKLLWLRLAISHFSVYWQGRFCVVGVALAVVWKCGDRLQVLEKSEANGPPVRELRLARLRAANRSATRRYPKQAPKTKAWPFSIFFLETVLQLYVKTSANALRNTKITLFAIASLLEE
jgi:hypothetical protein